MAFMRPKLIGAVSAIIALILLVSLAQEMNRRLQVQRELTRLQEEVQGMEKSIVELKNLNTYFNTDAYQERLAREKLNYQLPGEKVVLIPHANIADVATETSEAAQRHISNPERWWRAFFVPEQLSEG